MKIDVTKEEEASDVQTFIGLDHPNDGRHWDCNCARCGSSIEWEPSRFDTDFLLRVARENGINLWLETCADGEPNGTCVVTIGLTVAKSPDPTEALYLALIRFNGNSTSQITSKCENCAGYGTVRVGGSDQEMCQCQACKGTGKILATNL